MRPRLYSQAESELVFDWSGKWIELVKLTNEVTGSDEPPVKPPADLDEIRYQSLRFWFMEHQEQFVPLWRDFCESQSWTAGQECNTEDISGLEDIDKYLENPFLFFYKPDNLYQLARQLGLQDGVDIWEPDEHVAGMIRPVLIAMGRRTIEFIDWIDRRVGG